MIYTQEGKKHCFDCRKLLFKNDLVAGKFKRLFCHNCIQKKENLSSKENGDLYIKYIFSKMVGDMNA